MTATTVASLPLRELVSRRIAWAEEHYRQRATGRPTRHANNVSIALSRFLAFAELNAAKAQQPFTPDAAHINRYMVRSWMEQMVAERHVDGPLKGKQVLSRGTINAYLALLRQAVRWAADLGMVPEDVDDDLRRVRRLREGEGRETEPRMAHDEDIKKWTERVRCTLPHLTPTARDVVLLLLLSGARIGEVIAVTSGEVRPPEGDKPGSIWPRQHKNAHRGKKCSSRIRMLPLCAQAWAVVERRWKPLAADEPLFPPDKRRTGASPHFHVSAIQASITRACVKAGVPRYTPHQIRHAVGRKTYAECGLDIAQALLGHSTPTMTQHYAPPTKDKAFEAVPSLEGQPLKIAA